MRSNPIWSIKGKKEITNEFLKENKEEFHWGIGKAKEFY